MQCYPRSNHLYVVLLFFSPNCTLIWHLKAAQPQTKIARFAQKNGPNFALKTKTIFTSIPSINRTIFLKCLYTDSFCMLIWSILTNLDVIKKKSVYCFALHSSFLSPSNQSLFHQISKKIYFLPNLVLIEYFSKCFHSN